MDKNQTSFYGFPKPRILIVDDTLNSLRLFGSVMKNAGYEIFNAADGEEAIEIFHSTPLDMVLMDIIMSKLDGFEVCAQMRQHVQDDRIPILIITSLDDRQSIRRAFEAGATDYIIKPIPREILEHRIIGWLRAYRVETEVIRHNRFLAALNKANQAATSSLELDDILNNILRVLVETLEMTSGYVADIDLDQATTTELAKYHSDRAQPKPNPAEEKLSTYSLYELPTVEKWMSTSIPEYWTLNFDDPDMSDTAQSYLERYQINTVMFVPIYEDGQLFGYFEFWNTKRKRKFLMEDLALVQAAANQLGNHIHHARLHAELKASHAALEARNEELDAYSYTIAHDLQNPITNLLNYVSYVKDEEGDKLSDTAQQFLETVINMTLQMGHMVDQLLMLATVREDDRSMIRVAVPPLIEDVRDRFAADIRDKDITLQVSNNLPDVFGQPAWLREVLANLIANAIKSLKSNADHPTITIHGEAISEGRIRYEVTDNGVGIASDKVNQLFQQFTRGSKQSGHGLGLWIVRRLIEKMEGEVGVESTPQQGSTFWFILPAPPV